MTLSLDDVRNKRFRMARKSGYEVLEVDEFVDEVEVAFEQLTEENQNLKKQIEALQATSPADQTAPAVVETGPVEPETIVVTTGAEASSAVVRLVTLSTEQAERLVSEATEEAAKIRADATASAEEVTGEAQARADHLQTEAQQTADRVRSEAQIRADDLDAEIARRRAELLDDLSTERDELQIAVGRLRSFEATFRANLAGELREHITSLESRTAEPSDVPRLADPAAVTEAGQRSTGDLPTAESNAAQAAAVDTAADAEKESPQTTPGESADGAGSVFPDEDPAEEAENRTSETPRLDALLGDQR